MSDKKYFDREDISLRRMYDDGEIDSEEFLKKLFNSREADRERRKIVRKNKKKSESKNLVGI